MTNSAGKRTAIDFSRAQRSLDAGDKERNPAMRRAALACLVLASLATGCSRGPDNWYRAQSTPEQANSDERGCRDDALAVARQRSRMDANILADRGAGDVGSASISQSSLNINRYEQIATDERINVRALTRACMADRGYRLMRDE
jgi:hypothetical protein